MYIYTFTFLNLRVPESDEKLFAPKPPPLPTLAAQMLTATIQSTMSEQEKRNKEREDALKEELNKARQALIRAKTLAFGRVYRARRLGHGIGRLTLIARFTRPKMALASSPMPSGKERSTLELLVPAI